MKIRITKKGLPKAQMWNSQIGKPNIDQNGLIWGANPSIVTRQESEEAFGECGPGMVFSQIQQTCITEEDAKKEEQALAGFRNYLDRKKKGLPTNPFKTTGNEGTASNPMGATPPSPAPAAKEDKFKNAFIGFHTKFKNSQLGKTGEAINRTLDVAAPWITMWNNNKLTRERLDSVRNMNLPENAYFDSTIDRGDWDQEGIFRPNELGFDSKGEYTNATYAPLTFAAHGGVVNNPTNMKIRITGLPTQSMAYGGQSNYGLDLGRKKVYSDMTEDKSESMSSTMTSVPREMANIEAEGGETVYGDIDGDGGLEHMKISGPRHTEGGVPLNVPEGSFVFSDTKKMRIKDPEVLAFFSLSPRKEGYTPAEIAKRYDINKYKAIMEDPNADPIKKGTAQLMIKNFNKKLAALALIQEAMKGFPQGMPDVAKATYGDQMEQEMPMEDGEAEEMAYGGVPGLPKFQTTGQNNNPPYTPQIMQFLNPEAIALAKKISEENDAARRTAASQKNYGDIAQDFHGNFYYLNNLPASVTATNTGTTGPADINDPEFVKFMDLLKKYNNASKAASNKNAKDPNDKRDYFYINNVSDDDAEEFARLVTKFGFRRPAEGNYKGHVVIQGATPGYTFTGSGKKATGFFGGLKPEVYERKLVRQLVGDDAFKKMTPLEVRKKFLTEIGVDISKYSDTQLSDSKKLYLNKNFYENEFYPKYTGYFGADQYRPEMKDDKLQGLEHLDAQNIVKVQPSTDSPVTGYICVTNPDGTVIPQASTYMDEQARTEAGAYPSAELALQNCPKKTTKKGWRCLGLDKDKKPITIQDELGTFSSKEEAAKSCPTTPDNPWGFMWPDKLGIFAAAQGFPKKYMPYRRNVPFEPGKVVFEDWRAKAAQRFANTYAYPSEQLAAYTSPQGLASNYSFLAGQTGEGIGQDIAGVDSRNVATANQFLQGERQRKDQYNMLNALNIQDYIKDMAIVNQNYDNAKRFWTNNLVRQAQNAWGNRMYLGLLNSVNPIYNIMPNSGMSVFKGGYGTGQLAAYANRTGSKSPLDLNVEYLKDVPDGKGMSFKEWRDLKYGSMSNANEQMMLNPFGAAQQMLPLYGMLRNGYMAGPQSDPYASFMGGYGG